RAGGSAPEGMGHVPGAAAGPRRRAGDGAGAAGRRKGPVIQGRGGGLKRGRRSGWLIVSALLAVLAATSGCAWRTGEAAGRAETAEPVDPAIWPARYTQRLDEIAATMPETLDLKVIQFEQDEAGNWRQGWKPQPFFRVVDAEAHGHGVVVEV